MSGSTLNRTEPPPYIPPSVGGGVSGPLVHARKRSGPKGSAETAAFAACDVHARQRSGPKGSELVAGVAAPFVHCQYRVSIHHAGSIDDRGSPAAVVTVAVHAGVESSSS